jgi:hypothetical protein
MTKTSKDHIAADEITVNGLKRISLKSVGSSNDGISPNVSPHTQTV